MPIRVLIPFAALLGAPLAQTVTPTPLVRLDATYADDRGALQDHAPYLRELVRRHGDAGFRIGVALPEGAAARHAPNSGPWSITVVPQALPKFELTGLPGVDAWTLFDPDSVHDLLVASQRPDAEAHIAQMGKAWRYVWRHLGDGPSVQHGAARLVELFPNSGRAHAARYIDAVWYRGDFDGARMAAEQSLGVLAGDSWALVRFCDLVLRADANDRVLATAIAGALAPVIAAEPDAGLARRCWLRAALRADAPKVAATDVDAVWAIAQREPEGAREFAEVLALAPEPQRFRAAAQRALSTAAPHPDVQRLAATRFLVAQRCGEGEDLARHLAPFLGKEGSSYERNSTAWSLLVGFDTMGRFDPLALALMERVQQELGDRISDALLDTLALAMYGNGRFVEAAALEAQAIEKTDGDVRYERRLRRFEAMRARSR